MADVTSFLLSWWYTTDTKLAIIFNTVGANLTQGPLLGSLSSLNGLSSSSNENYHLENMITTHPVETGRNISDHIIIMPKVYTITGLLTAIDTIPIIGTGILNFNQLGSAIKFLFDSSDARTLFTLTTGLYFGQSQFKVSNVAIKTIDIPRDNQFGRTTIKFTITFQEMIITDTNAPTDNSSARGNLSPNASRIP